MKFRSIAISLVISAVCLYFVLRNVNWLEVWNHLTQVNLFLFSLSMLALLVAYFLMTWRWQSLLQPLELPDGQPVSANLQQQAGIFRLYGMMMTGYFFNSFFPARAGDLVRAY